MSRLNDSPDKEGQNSTHAIGHLGLVEVRKHSLRISLEKPTKIYSNTINWSNYFGSN